MKQGVLLAPTPGCILAPRSLERSCLTTGSNLELSRPPLALLCLPASGTPHPLISGALSTLDTLAPTSDLTPKCLCRRKIRRRAQKEETEKSHRLRMSTLHPSTIPWGLFPFVWCYQKARTKVGPHDSQDAFVSSLPLSSPMRNSEVNDNWSPQ